MTTPQPHEGFATIGEDELAADGFAPSPSRVDELETEVRGLRRELGAVLDALRLRPGAVSLAPMLTQVHRLQRVEAAAAGYVKAGLCGNPRTSEELTDLIAAVRTNGSFRG